MYHTRAISYAFSLNSKSSRIVSNSSLRIFLLRADKPSTRSRLISTSLSSSSYTINSCTISSMALSHSGDIDIRRYRVTSSDSVLVEPSRSTYVPYMPPSVTTCAPSSEIGGAKEAGSSFVPLVIVNPNSSAMDYVHLFQFNNILVSTSVTGNTSINFPPIILEGHCEFFDRIICFP